MKRIILMACIALGFNAGAQAQQVGKKAPLPVNTAAAKTIQKEKEKAEAVKIKQADAPVLKADGTPDLRYKQNKAQKAKALAKPSASGPVKKDGTPDKRYRANKKKG